MVKEGHKKIYATARTRTLGKKKTRENSRKRKNNSINAGMTNLQNWNKLQKKRKKERLKKKKELEEKTLIYPKENDSIKTADKKWVVKMLSTDKRIQKRMEVQYCKTKKPKGKIIYLSANGTGKIQGYVTFDGYIKLTKDNWVENRKLHRIPGGLYYTGKTKGGKIRENWGYYMNDPHTFPNPIPYKIIEGSRGWRYYHPIK